MQKKISKSSIPDKNEAIKNQIQLQQKANNPLSINQNNGIFNQQQTLIRIKQEYELCIQDNDLMQIGCNFGLENNNIFKWRITMIGPRNTPYENGLFTINAIFPQDYPLHGPEFKFVNKIYHLNVDFKNNLGHICTNNLNEWMRSGKVNGQTFYTVKQALFEIFCLFFCYYKEPEFYDARERIFSLEQFESEARKWTKDFASMN